MSSPRSICLDDWIYGYKHQYEIGMDMCDASHALTKANVSDVRIRHLAVHCSPTQCKRWHVFPIGFVLLFALKFQSHACFCNEFLSLRCACFCFCPSAVFLIWSVFALAFLEHRLRSTDGSRFTRWGCPSVFVLCICGLTIMVSFAFSSCFGRLQGMIAREAQRGMAL